MLKKLLRNWLISGLIYLTSICMQIYIQHILLTVMKVEFFGGGFEMKQIELLTHFFHGWTYFPPKSR